MPNENEHENESHHDPDERRLRSWERKLHRKQRARRDRRQLLGFGLGTFGLVGWSVTLPTLGGLALGRWLDHRAVAGGSRYTLTLLLAGLLFGCANAAYWLYDHHRRSMQARGASDPEEDPR